MRLYPHIPSLPKYPGPYNVGTVEVELALPKELHRTFGNVTVKTLLVRLFYPTSAKSGSKPRWTGAGNYTIRGYSNFLGVNETILRVASWVGLKWTRIPAISNAPLLARHQQQQQQTDREDSFRSNWPCCIFSHGLGGTRNAYSQISGSIASGGLVVMAIEHRDNSAAISVQRFEDEPIEVIEYISIKETNDETVRKRRHQMAQRAYEVKLGVELFRALEWPTSKSAQNFSSVALEQFKSRLSQFAGRLDVGPGRLIMAGHSMGAATAVAVCKNTTTTLPSDAANYQLQNEFRAAILLDPWMEVLVDTTSLPLKQPSIAIASEAFHNWNQNWRGVVQLLSGQSKLNKLCWLRQSAHLSQSDFQLLFPTATKYAFKAAIDPHLAMDLNVRLVREFLRESMDGVHAGDEEDGNVWNEENVVMHSF